MPPPYWNREWLDENSQRRYPLATDATGVDVTGDFVIPNNFLLSLYMPINAGMAVEPDKFYIRSITVYPTGYSIAVGYEDAIVATTVVARSTHERGASYALPGRDDFDDSTGKLVIGEVADVDMQPPGQYFFDFEAGKLDPDCIIPMVAGVSGITIVNGTERSEKLYGDIELISGSNIQLSVVSVGESSSIRVDAIEGTGLTEDCECDTDHDEAIPIRTINGLAPGPDGNFNLVNNDCVTITPIASGFIIENPCSRPCCGCPELEALTAELAQFGNQIRTLSEFVQRLSGEQSKMNMIVLGSKLNDRGCVEC